ECQMRQFLAVDSRVEELSEVGDLVALGGQPRDILRREDAVEQHESLDRASDRSRPAEAAVRFPDGLIEPTTMEMKNSSTAVGAPIDGGKAAMREIVEEVLCLLTMTNSGKRAIVAVHTDP